MIPVPLFFGGRDSAYNCTYLYYDESQSLSLVACKDFTDCKVKSKRSKDFIKMTSINNHSPLQRFLLHFHQ